MVRKVVIMQGLPGSGKSTLAELESRRLLAMDLGLTAIVSADHHFIVDGEYRFDPSQLGLAHAKCMRTFLSHLISGDVSHIIVDNTNITRDQIAPYYLAARAYGVEVEILRVKLDMSEAYLRNTHNVPWETMQRMAMNMEDPPPYWEATFTTVNNPRR